MIVGVLTVEFAVLEARSLKDKRSVLVSVKQRLRNRFNVSVAEVEFHDMPKRCRLALAMVSNEARALHSQLDLMVELVRRAPGLSLLDYQRELF